MYRQAYEICRDETMLTAYIYACSRYMQEDEYRKLLEENPSYSRTADRVEQMIEEKESGMKEEAAPEILEKWKHQFRRYL